jgi:pyruvate formate lyase activating enzyme
MEQRQTGGVRTTKKLRSGLKAFRKAGSHPMHFGGLQKISLIDYPGKISCVLFVSGCNFRCPYCHNPNLARGCPPPSQRVDEDHLFSFLRSRRDFLDGVVISGGEPTLLEHLATLCGRIKNLGYSVKLDTNGSRPRTIRRLIDRGLIDYIAMDVKTDPGQYAVWIQESCRPETILQSIRMILASGLPHEFKTTCLRPLVTPKTVETISRLVQGASLYALQQCRVHEVLRPDFVDTRCVRYSRGELLQLKSIAEFWVDACTVR